MSANQNEPENRKKDKMVLVIAFIVILLVLAMDLTGISKDISNRTIFLLTLLLIIAIVPYFQTIELVGFLRLQKELSARMKSTEESIGRTNENIKRIESLIQLQSISSSLISSNRVDLNLVASKQGMNLRKVLESSESPLDAERYQWDGLPTKLSQPIPIQDPFSFMKAYFELEEEIREFIEIREMKELKNLDLPELIDIGLKKVYIDKILYNRIKFIDTIAEEMKLGKKLERNDFDVLNIIFKTVFSLLRQIRISSVTVKVERIKSKIRMRIRDAYPEEETEDFLKNIETASKNQIVNEKVYEDMRKMYYLFQKKKERRKLEKTEERVLFVLIENIDRYLQS